MRPKRNIRRGIPQRYKKEVLRHYNEDILSLLEIIRFGNRYVHENNHQLTRDLFFASHTRITRQTRNRRNSARHHLPRYNAARRVASHRIAPRRVGGRPIRSNVNTNRKTTCQIGTPKNGSRRNISKRKISQRRVFQPVVSSQNLSSNSLQRNATPDEYYGNLEKLCRLGKIDDACQLISSRNEISNRNNRSLISFGNCTCKKQTSRKSNNKKIKNNLPRERSSSIQHDNVKIAKTDSEATMCGCCPNTRILGEKYKTSFQGAFMGKRSCNPLTPLPIPPIPIPEPVPQRSLAHRPSIILLEEPSTSAAANAILHATQQTPTLREENVAKENLTESSQPIENGNEVNDEPDVGLNSETRIICRFSNGFPQPILQIENDSDNNINVREGGDSGACGDGNHNDAILEIQITLRSSENITIALEGNDDDDDDDIDEEIETTPHENNQTEENPQNGTDAPK